MKLYSQTKNGALFLIRGVPGAGKTSFVEQILADNMAIQSHCSVSIATDDYFYNSDGDYEWDGNLLKTNHEACQAQVEEWMMNKITTKIFIHNTFSVYDPDMKPYHDLKDKYNWFLFSVIVENRHGGMNIHGVDPRKVKAMKQRFEVVL